MVMILVTNTMPSASVPPTEPITMLLSIQDRAAHPRTIRRGMPRSMNMPKVPKTAAARGKTSVIDFQVAQATSRFTASMPNIMDQLPWYLRARAILKITRTVSADAVQLWKKREHQGKGHIGGNEQHHQPVIVLVGETGYAETQGYQTAHLAQHLGEGHVRDQINHPLPACRSSAYR